MKWNRPPIKLSTYGGKDGFATVLFSDSPRNIGEDIPMVSVAPSLAAEGWSRSNGTGTFT
jgi:hypothetical protein